MVPSPGGVLNLWGMLYGGLLAYMFKMLDRFVYRYSKSSGHYLVALWDQYILIYAFLPCNIVCLAQSTWDSNDPHCSGLAQDATSTL